MSPALPLTPGDVHLWYALLDAPAPPDWPERCQAVLSVDETARQQRFHFEKDRRSFLLSHGLLRFVLSAYRPDVPPITWRFVRGTHGKPLLADATMGLSFNLTHTMGLAAVAVVRDLEVGVDAEFTERSNASLGLAERFFAPAETATLRGLDGEALRSGFFNFWTLKEAYIKARGVGLALPLDGFAFDLQPGRAPCISFTERIVDDPSSWEFAQFQATVSHRLAVAVRRPPSQRLTFTLRRWVPGLDDSR
ncbi:MAG: 4'-phosphopantetheinyl transferase superfamily protein [Planctomycetia bacterium]|nr:4'-phosphopantetheinyl transferase superfamily protein [Planctomycetia bacterium]